jgi:hypothetical protein
MSTTPTTAVYRVKANVDGFQYLVYDGNDDEYRSWSRGIDRPSKGERLGDRWEPPPVYSPEPRLKRPDIWWISVWDDFALSERAVEALGARLWSVELLPLPYGDEVLQVVNVLDVIDCLDRERSEFAPTGAVERYSFVSHRVPESPLFKIPEDIVIFMPEFDAIRPSLRRLVELHDLQGFRFDELWNDEEGSKPLPRAF